MIGRQFTPEFIYTPAFNPVEIDRIRIQEGAQLKFDSIEFEGIGSQHN